MIKKFLKSLKFKSSYSSPKEDENLNNNSIDINPLIQVAKLLSENDPEVVSRVSLYIDDSKKYYSDNEDELTERCIDSDTDLTCEIVLINELKNSSYIAYIDHSEEADRVIKFLDELSGNKLSVNNNFEDLISAYNSTGKYYAISNFLYDSKIGPMPYEFLQNLGYSLANIDEGSDALALILVKNNVSNNLIEIADSASLKLRILG